MEATIACLCSFKSDLKKLPGGNLSREMNTLNESLLVSVLRWQIFQGRPWLPAFHIPELNFGSNSPPKDLILRMCGNVALSKLCETKLF